MYYLNIVLIGCDQSVLPEVRREALNNSATVDAEYGDVTTALAELDTSAEKSWLFVIHIASEAELSQLRRLRSAFTDRPIIALVDANKNATLVVSNRYDPKLHGFSAERLRVLLKCPGLATVANDQTVSLAVDQGRPLRLQSAKSVALAEIRRLMERMAPPVLPSQVDTASPSLFSRISHAFSTPAKV